MRKQRAVRRIYGMKYSWKGHKNRTRHKNKIKVEASLVSLCKKHKLQHPHHVKMSLLGPTVEKGQAFWQMSWWFLVEEGKESVSGQFCDRFAGYSSVSPCSDILPFTGVGMKFSWRSMGLAYLWCRFDSSMWQGTFCPESTFSTDSLTVSVHPSVQSMY